MKPPPINLTAPPPCRIAGLAWIPNEYGEVLTLSANRGEEAGHHRLPGDHADERQSNLAAMVSHVRHGTGLDPVPTRLLGTDWAPHSPAEPAAMGQSFIYLCARVPTTASIALPPTADGEKPELSGYLWQTPDTARHTMRPYQLRRFLGLWRAWHDDKTSVLHSGRPALSAAASEAP
ncbi:hypothetical protein ACFWMU_08115 [Streptomyces sp. NPDC058357]|uniref:hypothetical protein n=1 Tax=unclassified Streptomyces TaxID=2593676 RepID=UPI003667B314